MKLSYFLFGYRKIITKHEDSLNFLNLLLKNGIELKKSDNVFVIKEKDFVKVKEISKGKIRYESSDRLGFTGIVLSACRSYGMCIGVILAIILNIALSVPVWDVRVEGNEKLSDEHIIGELKECGFGVGSPWFSFDKNRTEAEFLDKNSDVAWMTINRRGTVAYVEVKENLSAEDDKEQEFDKKINIVADRDALIEEITVNKGVAAVKVGDIVKKGDVLISGVIDSEGGTSFVGAEGTVVGRSVKDISVFVPRLEEEVVEKNKKLIAREIKIFDFHINIFKKYRNSDIGCDIINDEKEFVILGKYKLPLSINSNYILTSEFGTKEYSDKEITSIAQKRMASALFTMLSDSDLIKIKTDAGFLDDGYYMHTYVVYSSNIGIEKEFEVQ